MDTVVNPVLWVESVIMLGVRRLIPRFQSQKCAFLFRLRGVRCSESLSIDLF